MPFGSAVLSPAAVLASLVFMGSASSARADFDIKANYSKSEYQVPMRDGVKLFTAVYRPKSSSQMQPILLQRTPYSIAPYGPGEFPQANDLAPAEDFLREGYIFVMQDARGTNKSGGDWVDMRPPLPRPLAKRAVDESTDTYDTIEWLLKNVPGNNGRVGQWGISYPGWYAVMGMLHPHPALKAVSPQATTADPFFGDDFHHNGAFLLMALDWTQSMSIAEQARLNPANPLAKLDYGTPWAYEFYLRAGPIDQMNEKYFGGRLMRLWSDFIEHPDYDEYWRSRNFLKPLVDIGVPVLNVAGWFDEYDMYGGFSTYQAIEQQNPRNRSVLVAGPWRHGGWVSDKGDQLGDMQFGVPTSEHFQKKVVFPFFQHYLKSTADAPLPEAVVFETGENRWHNLEQWPPRGTQPRNLYLHANGRLSFEAPSENGPKARDSYVSNPAKPVPYTREITMEDGYRWMVEDQRPAFTRPDVLSWQTEPLTEDVTIAGSIPVRLFASTSGSDSDWFVKLIDVQPPDAAHMPGAQLMLGFEVMRGKYRDSLEKPAPMTPDAVTPIQFEIWDKFHTFKKGHRIMVQVQSSMFPYFDRNPQTFTNIYRAREAHYLAATQNIYRSREAASHLVLPVLRSR